MESKMAAAHLGALLGVLGELVTADFLPGNLVSQ